MKIALLSEKYPPDIGGHAISAGRLGELLASAGHEVRVFAPTLSATIKTSSDLSAYARQSHTANGVNVTRFGAHKRAEDTLVDWFEFIVAEHKRAPFDLLHGYSLPQAGFIAAYAGKYLDVPSVVSIHGSDIEQAAFNPSEFPHIMYALQNAAAVTANTSELVRKATALAEREIYLLPKGVDTKKFKKMERNHALSQSLGLNVDAQGERKPVIGFVGEMRSKKGFSTLLVGYAQINKKRPTTLLIVGDVRVEEYQTAFEEFQRENPETQIIVTGYVPHKDLPAYYSLIDVFANLSLRDGLPNALLEAMACEVPVIATPVGGLLDFMEEGVNLKTVPVKNISVFVNVARKLLKDEEEQNRIGKAARETVLKKFTLEQELEAVLNVYTALGRK